MPARDSLAWLLALAIGCGGSTAHRTPPARADDPDPRAARRAEVEAEEAKQAAELGTCDDESYDFRRIACRSFCPSYPVAGEPSCDSVCPRTAPEPHIRACQPVMPCPTPPDRRVLACMRDIEQRWSACDRAHPSLANPRCDGTSPVPGTLTAYELGDDGRYRLHIAPCGNRGVAAGWRGHLVDTNDGTAVDLTDFEVVTATQDVCTAITTDAVDHALIQHSTRTWMSP